jgi:quinol monooxygenase YgiN
MAHRITPIADPDALPHASDRPERLTRRRSSGAGWPGWPERVVIRPANDSGGTMHAVITNVEIELGRADEVTAALTEMIVPQAKSSEGFVGGYWMRSADQAFGMSIELYESHAAAEAALQARPSVRPPSAPVSIISVRLMDIVATA